MYRLKLLYRIVWIITRFKVQIYNDLAKFAKYFLHKIPKLGKAVFKQNMKFILQTTIMAKIAKFSANFSHYTI